MAGVFGVPQCEETFSERATIVGVDEREALGVEVFARFAFKSDAGMTFSGRRGGRKRGLCFGVVSFSSSDFNDDVFSFLRLRCVLFWIRKGDGTRRSFFVENFVGVSRGSGVTVRGGERSWGSGPSKFEPTVMSGLVLVV